MENEHFKIKSVKNLVPVWIEYESNGSPHNALVYVNYEKQEIVNCETSFHPPTLSPHYTEFKKAVFAAIQEKNSQMRGVPLTPIPPEIHKQFQERKVLLEKHKCPKKLN